MAPKRKSIDVGNSAKPKRSREVLPLSEKMKILDLILKEKKSHGEVARMYKKNESSIREVLKKEKEIRASFACAPKTAKVTSVVRDKYLVETEKALNLWLTDMNRKSSQVDGYMLRQKALSLYQDFSKGSTENRHTKAFTASKGWLYRFRNRNELQNPKITEDAPSTEEESAARFSAELKKLIEEKGYLPEQVFNCDETMLFWNKVPNQTCLKSAKEAKGFKACNDMLTLVLCGNAAGHMIKPGIVYRAKNPRSLKNKNKNHLPVFWQHNKGASVTDTLFLEWFRQCFILEVKKYLTMAGLGFKVLLLIDDATGHPKFICSEDENVHILFIPTNITSLLQPLDQGIIRWVKAMYTRKVFDHMRTAIDADPNVDIMKCWKSFTIADAITFIKAAMDELKPEIVNACWKPIWSEVVNDFNERPEIDEEVEKILQVTREFRGGRVVDMSDEEVEVHIEGRKEVLTSEELVEVVISASEDEGENEAEEEPATWTLQKFGEVFQMAQNLKDKIMEYDPWMERSIQVSRMITEALRPLQQHFDELKDSPSSFVAQRSPEADDPSGVLSGDT